MCGSHPPNVAAACHTCWHPLVPPDAMAVLGSSFSGICRSGARQLFFYLQAACWLQAASSQGQWHACSCGRGVLT